MHHKSSFSSTFLVLFFGSLVLRGFLFTQADSPKPDTAGTRPVLRRPVAVVPAGKSPWLFVANRRSGSISVIDTKNLKAAGEFPVGKKLSDLAATPDARHLLAVDEEANQLVILARRGKELSVIGRLGVAATPVSIQAAADGARCFVASLWSRQVSLIDLGWEKEGKKALPGPRVAKSIALPFAPRRQLLLPKAEKLIVADAFGGQLAVVDVKGGWLESVRSIPGHNIRGLALSPDGSRLLLTHQILHAMAQSTFDDVHWGNLMTNNLRSLMLARVLNPRADLLRGSDLDYLGDAERGAGDPAGLAVTAEGTEVIALSGVNEIALRFKNKADWQRLAVGRGPTAVRTSLDGRTAFVANTFADSVSVVDVKAAKVRAEVSLGKKPEPGRDDLGEMLFHDARLSHDGWFSCHSCHTDGHTNGRLNDNLSDGSLGTPKRILSLLGTKDTGPWAWNGSMKTLEAQITQSIQSTMQGKKPSRDQVKALAAFLRTLPPPPSLDRLTGKVDREVVRRGRLVFQKQACATCHAPPAYTSARTYDVGLKDEAGNRQFNPPSLRGISQGGPFFHDNRAASLEEVFTRYRHQLKGKLSKQELADLIGFLRSL
jgi:YVTN family beta-propeller protein